MGFITGYAPERVAYIRRYKMKDGSTMTCPPVGDPNIDHPIGELDQRVHFLRFDREGGASIVLVNYGLHADTINGELFSADWPGWMRKTVEKALDGTKCMFYAGAQGDVGSTHVFPEGGDMNDTEISFDNEMKSPGMARFVGRALAGTVLQVYDKVDGSFTESKTLDRNTYVLEHQIDTKKAQEYLLVIKAMDGHDLVSEKNIQVIVKEKPEEETQQKQETNQQNTSDAIAPTYMNGILLVNKTHPIPRDFGGNDNTAYNALLELQQGALAVGYNIPLLSGYRSYDYQKSLYEAYVARDGVEAADRYSAKPGTSEHQTGLAFDVGELSWDYGQTAPGQWLVENCAQYGFILRYLDGKEHITGYMYEPWHIRYVGVEHATAIMSQGITLEEYLGV
jgi:LAS superfamily LD-carboxypeptidase LdcB